mmetsp:Transcript_11261/g.28353  ORF Transcript_11261/g.28353 Transcript_11261/m.28353 type:complete len:241 (+) Transcript_11261:1074-1796(+)
MRRTLGISSPRSKSLIKFSPVASTPSSVSIALDELAASTCSQLTVIGTEMVSATTKGLTRKAGLSMAHCSAQPRLTHSSAFWVVERPKLSRDSSRPRTSEIFFLTARTRVDPPMISTAEILSMVSSLSSMARSRGACTRSTSGSMSLLNSSRESWPRRSVSLRRNSTLMLAMPTPSGVRVCLSFSQPLRSLSMALGLPSGSALCFSLNSAAKCLASTMSMSRPPRLGSLAEATMVSLPWT